MEDDNKSKDRRQDRRYVPGTDAEFASNVTRPTWDSRVDNTTFDDKVSKEYYLYDADGTPVLDKNGEHKKVTESLLSLYGIFKQDWRLGNVDSSEVQYVREHIDLGYDLLQSGYKDSSMMCHERGISVMETSHSKRGWFRKILATLINENNYSQTLEPQGSLWKGGKGGKE